LDAISAVDEVCSVTKIAACERTDDTGKMSRGSAYRRRHLEAVLQDPVIGPALKYARKLYPEEIGIPEEFKCIIWLASTRYPIC